MHTLSLTVTEPFFNVVRSIELAGTPPIPARDPRTKKLYTGCNDFSIGIEIANAAKMGTAALPRECTTVATFSFAD
jgi:hypothetical protein